MLSCKDYKTSATWELTQFRGTRIPGVFSITESEGTVGMLGWRRRRSKLMYKAHSVPVLHKEGFWRLAAWQWEIFFKSLNFKMIRITFCCMYFVTIKRNVHFKTLPLAVFNCTLRHPKRYPKRPVLQLYHWLPSKVWPGFTEGRRCQTGCLG